MSIDSAQKLALFSQVAKSLSTMLLEFHHKNSKSEEVHIRVDEDKQEMAGGNGVEKVSGVQLLDILPDNNNRGKEDERPLTVPEVTLTVALYGDDSIPPSEAATPLQNTSVAASRESLIPDKEDREGWRTISIQVFVPFIIAGMGMVGAGIILDDVQHWLVFNMIPELFILVPALLGLKGNLEMTLAARLSTLANLGIMDKPRDMWSISCANIALTQLQAIIIAFLASMVAVVTGIVQDGTFNLNNTLLLSSCSMVTASIASWVLGIVMVAVIILSRKCNINPDNIATPIAASLGDVITLGILSWVATLLYGLLEDKIWVCYLINAGFFATIPMWAWLASRNDYTRPILKTGWTPIIIAMLISSCGGIILDQAITRFTGIAVFQPVINGAGGNLVAVLASRMATTLHRSGRLGTLPAIINSICMSPIQVFFGSTNHSRSARILLLMVLPGHLIFSYTICYFQYGHASLTPLFLFSYLTAAFLQVAILLYIAVILIYFLWSKKIDPDTSAIPYMTALGDLLGTGLLFIAFEFLALVGGSIQYGAPLDGG